jgi:hypothetical protein
MKNIIEFYEEAYFKKLIPDLIILYLFWYIDDFKKYTIIGHILMGIPFLFMALPFFTASTIIVIIVAIIAFPIVIIIYLISLIKIKKC